MGRRKFVIIVLVMLMLFILLSATPIVSAGKAFYWIVTDGEIDPLSDSAEYTDAWTGDDPQERVAEFQWYVDRDISRGGSPTGQDKPVGGTKATLSMTSSGNDLQLIIEIYKGGAKKPSAGPETYQWTIIDGMDSANDCINVIFTNSITGKLISEVSLYENDIVNIGIPNVLIFECTMSLV